MIFILLSITHNYYDRVSFYSSATGWYIYVETSLPRRVNDKARLISQNLAATTAYCLSFYYHMYGPHINNLNIYIKVIFTVIIPGWHNHNANKVWRGVYRSHHKVELFIGWYVSKSFWSKQLSQMLTDCSEIWFAQLALSIDIPNICAEHLKTAELSTLGCMWLIHLGKRQPSEFSC